MGDALKAVEFLKLLFSELVRRVLFGQFGLPGRWQVELVGDESTD